MSINYTFILRDCFFFLKKVKKVINRAALLDLNLKEQGLCNINVMCRISDPVILMCMMGHGRKP